MDGSVGEREQRAGELEEGKEEQERVGREGVPRHIVAY